jgi:hypothetical protein
MLLKTICGISIGIVVVNFKHAVINFENGVSVVINTHQADVKMVKVLNIVYTVG